MMTKRKELWSMQIVDGHAGLRIEDAANAGDPEARQLRETISKLISAIGAGYRLSCLLCKHRFTAEALPGAFVICAGPDNKRGLINALCEACAIPLPVAFAKVAAVYRRAFSGLEFVQPADAGHA
jgi:hypothetical protein